MRDSLERYVSLIVENSREVSTGDSEICRNNAMFLSSARLLQARQFSVDQGMFDRGRAERENILN